MSIDTNDTTKIDGTSADTRVSGTARTAVRSVSFARLLRVEARKLVDTRAGRWLLGICAAITALSAWGAIVWMPDLDVETAPSFVYDIALLPAAFLVPVIAILAATAEWSQRTGLVTFALEPRRLRVVAAKVVVACGAGLLAVAGILALVYGGLGVSALLGDAPASWAMSGPRIAGSALVVVLTMLQAGAFGFATLNTAAAIVSFFALPTVITVATTLSTWLGERAAWFDIGATGTPFAAGTATATDWAHLATAAAIWVVLPMAIGIVRVLRADMK
ncbi:MAG: ABC transporter permease [Dermatophilus congolensis]|nr:ABC transporter permease [Dermatophilus congolensis]